jgi:hypothetical protein
MTTAELPAQEVAEAIERAIGKLQPPLLSDRLVLLRKLAAAARAWSPDGFIVLDLNDFALIADEFPS